MKYKFRGKITYNAHIIINGRAYYFADPVLYTNPINPREDLKVSGSFVGESTWSSIKIKKIIPIKIK